VGHPPREAERCRGCREWVQALPSIGPRGKRHGGRVLLRPGASAGSIENPAPGARIQIPENVAAGIAMIPAPDHDFEIEK